jgi:outer membrane receptor protein involved in Fe transport
MNAALGVVDAPGLGTSAVYAETRSDDIREAAAYGELTYALTGSLSLTAGLRWFDYGLDTASRVTQGAGLRAFSGRLDENGLSPKLLLSYAPSPDLLLYAQAAEGYRAGGFNTAGRLDASASPYHPDELWNYEIGAKARWLDDRVQLRAALFAADWTSIQSDQYRPDGLAYTANVGAGHNLGLELETVWRATSRLDLRAAALVSQPSLKRRDPALNPASVALAGINGATASVAFDHHRPVGAGATIHLRGRVRYVGHAILNLEPQAPPAPDFVEASASLAWEAPRWTLTAYVDNLLDRTSDSFAFGNPFNRADAAVTPLRPRTVGARLSRRF